MGAGLGTPALGAGSDDARAAGAVLTRGAGLIFAATTAGEGEGALVAVVIGAGVAGRWDGAEVGEGGRWVGRGVGALVGTGDGAAVGGNFNVTATAGAVGTLTGTA
ncbi:MAG: hypothetical protein ACYDGM_11830, partial [Vulcanimicrobiaceae bacterium]